MSVTGPADGGRLAARVEALGRFLRVVSPHVVGVPVPTLDPTAIGAARNLVGRAEARISLGQADPFAHTLVALAGATGSGKSSVFNALAGLNLSPTGPLRPTTGLVHACVWGTDAAEPLLDWLRVDPGLRFARESPLDAEDEAALRGLVLLDLPDVDSVVPTHRAEADRLLQVVDLVIWVLDPQKYADARVHEDHLRRLGAVREVIVVVLNQIDRLRRSDAAQCLADLQRLMAAEGLARVPVLATSAKTGEGVPQVRRLLERVVASRRAGYVRLDGEVTDAVAALAPLVGGVGASRLTEHAVDELAAEFAAAAGVSAVASEAGRVYLAQAELPGWPINRRRESFAQSTVASSPAAAVDTSRQDELAGRPLSTMAFPDTELPPADPARVGSAVRRLAANTSAGLPAPWPDEVRLAASAAAAELPDEIGRAVRGARPAPPPTRGWQVARAVWWIAFSLVLLGAVSLLWSALPGSDRWPPAVWELSGLRVAWLLTGTGMVVATGVVLVGRALAEAKARRWHAETEKRLREATAGVARAAVAPVDAVLHDYAEADLALRAAASERPAVGR